VTVLDTSAVVDFLAGRAKGAVSDLGDLSLDLFGSLPLRERACWPPDLPAEPARPGRLHLAALRP